MRLGVVSDVHNNVEALGYALEQLKGCDLVLSLGDLISDYRVSPDIIRLAREADLVGIQGNHETSIFLHPGSRMKELVAADDLDYLAELPAQRELVIDGRRVRVTHGSPWDDPTDYRCHYISSRDPADVAKLRATDADLVLIGHTHHALGQRFGAVLVVNPGSCGEARDRQHRLSFAELDFSHGAATVFQIRAGGPPDVILTAEL